MACVALGGGVAEAGQARVRFSHVGVYGDLDVDGVRAALDKSTRALQQCYQRALKTSPDLEGRRFLQLEIDASGRLTQVSAGFDNELEKCTQTSLKRVRFKKPRNRKPVTVHADLAYLHPSAADNTAVGTAIMRKPRSVSIGGGRSNPDAPPPPPPPPDPVIPSRVVLGTVVEVSGALDRKAVTAALRQHLQPITACYGPVERLPMQIAIAADGHVTSAGLGTHFVVEGLSELEKCVADVLVGIQFPAAGAESNVVAPFTFAWGSEADED